MDPKEFRVRFAPSPTGFLHIGGARTALFNFLFARHHGATFILRIEDTDVARSTQASVDQILDALRWLGLEWDEGPFYQSQRGDLYRAALERLEKQGRLYRSYMTPEEQNAQRDEALANRTALTFKRRLSDLPAEEAKRRAEADQPYVLRMDVGEEGEVAWNDRIRGRTAIRRAEIEDFVVARSDGSPTYNFVCAVDDADMEITHVVRGEDHIPNTPKQILVLEALGHAIPEYAHVSLILGPDRTRLSKRHGATSVQQFREQGYLPDALANFLALLGWSYDDSTEIFSREELVRYFTLDRVNKAAAICDLDKLNHLNAYYLRNQPKEETIRQVRQVLGDAGILERPIYKKRGDEWLESIIELEIERSRLLTDFVEGLRYFFEKPRDFDRKGTKKFFMQQNSMRILRKVRDALVATTDMSPESLDKVLRGVADEMELGFGKVAQPVRLALTGRTASPGLYDVIIGVGREEAVARIDYAMAWIEQEKARAETETTLG